MLRSKRRTSPDDVRSREIIEEYRALTERLAQIRTLYDLAEEDSDIDALIYEENAVQCRLTALCMKARRMSVHADIFDHLRS